MPSDLLGEESRLPRSPWQLSKPRCRVTGPPWLQLSKPARPTWGLGEPWPRLPLPHTPGSGSCHLVPDRQCVPPASCSGHGIPEDAAVATATKPAKPGARQGPSSEPQGWLPPLDSQTSQYKDLRSVCSPPVPGTHPTAEAGLGSGLQAHPVSAGGSGQRRWPGPPGNAVTPPVAVLWGCLVATRPLEPLGLQGRRGSRVWLRGAPGCSFTAVRLGRGAPGPLPFLLHRQVFHSQLCVALG